MAYIEKSNATFATKNVKNRAFKNTLERRKNRAGFLFVLPSMIFIGVFFIAPLLMTAWMSFYNWPLLGEAHFIGIKNYLSLLTDTNFWQSLWFTTKYTLIVTPPIFVISLALALLVRQRVPGVGLFRTAFFLPVVIGLSTASILWVWLLNDQVGIFDAILQSLHIIHDPIVWLADPTVAIIAIVVMIVWKAAGSSMIFFLIGLNAIPEEFYDAAQVDGAGWWQRLRYITLPLLRRTFALALVLSVIGSYLAFDQFYIMTQGGPQNQTLTVVYWIFNNSFTYYKLGYGSALSIVLLGILIILSVAQLYLLRDDTRY